MWGRKKEREREREREKERDSLLFLIFALCIVFDI
jgi:predicted nucleic acid-binding Zn ribbon protein